MMAAMNGPLPLPALLSHLLIAFTIEFDNEFEHRVPHRTTNHGSTTDLPHAPWLVSMVMWSNFMRFVPDDGVTAGELKRLLGITDKALQTWLTRMGKWWGYVAVEASSKGRSGLKRAYADAVIRPTAAGRGAQAAWRPLAALIEKRWQDRFSKDKDYPHPGSIVDHSQPDRS
jgi:hypothetical protein